MLNGEVNPNGISTTYYFEYGLSLSYGFYNPIKSGWPATSTVFVNEQITDLTQDTNYYYRIVASNSGGSSYGDCQTLITEKDTDGDDLSDSLENATCTVSNDVDTDDDGIIDGDEDANHKGIVDPGETDPCNPDTDGDGIQDGTEIGVTEGVADPDGDGPLKGTDPVVFCPDEGVGSTTEPLNPDSDNDGLTDGQEDLNGNGMVDAGERDPSSRDMSFAADSDQISNLYTCFVPHEKKIYAGTGSFENFLRYIRTLNAEVVAGWRAGGSGSRGMETPPTPKMIPSGTRYGWPRIQRVLFGCSGPTMPRRRRLRLSVSPMLLSGCRYHLLQDRSLENSEGIPARWKRPVQRSPC